MRKFTWLLVLAVPMTIISCQKDAVQKASDEGASFESVTTGNGAESGSHYTLNIIGVKDPKDATMDNNDGRRIFVALGSKGTTAQSKIMLLPGEDFNVLDANATDDPAEFQLPSGITPQTYKIYARALGKPGGSAIITTCADADLTDDYYPVCSDVSTDALTAGKRPRFEDVTDELLTIVINTTFTFVNGDGVTVEVKEGTYNIFNPIFEDYFWQVDNNGLKLLQLRFYPVSNTQ